MVGWLPFGVPTGPEVGRASRLQDLPDAGGGPLVACSCLLVALLLCLWCVALEYGSICDFKGVFSGFYVFGVGLCCWLALRGLWGVLCA